MGYFLGVFIGGGFGAVLRYGISLLVAFTGIQSLWIATLIANLLGCGLLFLGVKSGLAQLDSIPIKVGFLGALTTFSTLSFEMFQAFDQKQYLIVVMIFALNFLGAFLLWFFIQKTF